MCTHTIIKNRTKPARINDDPTRPTCWRPLTLRDTAISVWQERDRLHVSITRNDTGATLAEWWDQDVADLYADGFLKSGRPFGGLSERDPVLHRSAFEYLQHLGIV